MQYNHKKARIGVLTGVLALNMANFASAEPSLERGTYLVEGPAACGNNKLDATGETSKSSISRPK